MRVFVTGATGFIGTPVVRTLIAAGHEVLGMARSDDGVSALAGLGAAPHRGSLSDLDSLRRGAAGADAVLHLAFIHDWSKFAESCEIDRQAIAVLGATLTGSDRALIVTGGLGGLTAPGRLTTEEDAIPPDFPFPRVSEQTALSLKGVRAAVVRLPQVHDTTRQGLVTRLVATARDTGVSAYVEDGRNQWAAAHVSDVARLYRLVLENPEAGARYHAVAEEGVTMRAIAQAIGDRLRLPVKSLPAAEAPAHFGWLAPFVADDLAGSSARTRQRTGWQPAGPGLLADLARLVA